MAIPTRQRRRIRSWEAAIAAKNATGQGEHYPVYGTRWNPWADGAHYDYLWRPVPHTASIWQVHPLVTENSFDTDWATPLGRLPQRAVPAGVIYMQIGH